MAGEASAKGYHLGGLFAVTMALQTGKPFHSHAVDNLVLVTARTCLFIRCKGVKAAGVAITAADVLHEHMAGVAIRIAQSDGPLRDL